MTTLVLVYCLQGVGRVACEGTLKAEFAEKIDNKEAAFGNIIFQNGLLLPLILSLRQMMVVRMLVITALRFTMSACTMCWSWN